jgi:hypothetical protein
VKRDRGCEARGNGIEGSRTRKKRMFHIRRKPSTGHHYSDIKRASAISDVTEQSRLIILISTANRE